MNHILKMNQNDFLANHSLKQLNILNNEQSEHEIFKYFVSFNICKPKWERLFQYHLVHLLKIVLFWSNLIHLRNI